MKANRFFNMFPVPKFLQMAAAGIDISDRSLKFFQLIEKRGQLIDGWHEEVELPAGIIEGGRIIQADKLKPIINSLSKKYGVTRAIVSLPEDRAYTLQLNLPQMKKSQLREAIAFQLEEYVPLPSNEIVFDYKLVKSGGDKNSLIVAVSALPKTIITEYVEVFSGTSMVPIAFEIEAQAMARSLLSRDSNELALIVDIGRVHVGFFVARQGEVLYASIANNIGGDDISAIISRQLNISLEEAEKLKNEIGLNRSEDNKDSFFAAIPVITSIKDEINQRCEYWRNREKYNPRTERIARIVLCGGQSTLPGLLDFLQSYFDIPVELGNPWQNFYPAELGVPKLSLKESLRYATALGLSLRSFEEIF
ncbi:MAG: pilus assembly protein PilM [Candidatus Paceibacterota bacterium]|jgi:type IV pilus assembly protein PilM